jgi:hypothetical protein
MEGILAVTPEGRIVGANRGALEQLGLSGAALRRQGLQALLGVSVAALVDRFRSPLSTPLQVYTATGQALFVHARFDWPVWRDITQRAAVPVHVASADHVAKAPISSAAFKAITAGAALQPAPAGLDDVDTGDPAVAALVHKLKRVVNHGVPVLVQGDPGTGKRWLVQALHQHSAQPGTVPRWTPRRCWASCNKPRAAPCGWPSRANCPQRCGPCCGTCCRPGASRRRALARRCRWTWPGSAPRASPCRPPAQTQRFGTTSVAWW